MAHTKGPWHVGGNGTIVYASDGFAVASAAVFHGRHGGADEAVANAHLIAAAPDLRSSLIALMGTVQPELERADPKVNAAMEAAREVICKTPGA